MGISPRRYIIPPLLPSRSVYLAVFHSSLIKRIFAFVPNFLHIFLLRRQRVCVIVITYSCTRVFSQPHVRMHANTAVDWLTTVCGAVWQLKQIYMQFYRRIYTSCLTRAGFILGKKYIIVFSIISQHWSDVSISWKTATRLAYIIESLTVEGPATQVIVVPSISCFFNINVHHMTTVTKLMANVILFVIYINTIFVNLDEIVFARRISRNLQRCKCNHFLRVCSKTRGIGFITTSQQTNGPRKYGTIVHYFPYFPAMIRKATFSLFYSNFKKKIFTFLALHTLALVSM